MCKRRDSIQAVGTAAEELAEACLPHLPWCGELLRDPATLKHLPEEPPDFHNLLNQIERADRPARLKTNGAGHAPSH